MQSHASFELYLAAQSPRNRALIRAVRAFVARAQPGLVEGVKWGNGCWLLDGGPIAYVYADKDHVQFGFLRGSALTDPDRRLLGNGQYVRHVKLRTEADLDEKASAAWLGEAVRLGPVRPGGKRVVKKAAKKSAQRAAKKPGKKAAKKA